MEGFNTLASAIDSLDDMISGALSDLSSTLHVSVDRILEKADADEGRRRKFEEKTLQKQDKQTDILDKQTDMLDNIQRGRKPFP